MLAWRNRRLPLSAKAGNGGALVFEAVGTSYGWAPPTANWRGGRFSGALPWIAGQARNDKYRPIPRVAVPYGALNSKFATTGLASPGRRISVLML
jgi:hypothetical protein